jgi:hypothetical protein
MVALVLLMAPGRLAAQRPTLQNVLDRATTYVSDFKRTLSGIVAEEEYTQQITRPQPVRGEVTHRQLRSDLLLVRAADANRYVEFRDVFEVDGQPVRDREERLSKLFLDPSASAGQLDQIIAESARYNIGAIGSQPVKRNINIPTLALLFLDPSFRPRFTFNRVTDRAASVAALTQRPGEPAAPTFSVSTEVWVIAYRESKAGTIIRAPDGHDLPARGRFWIEPSTGRVLMTELMTGAPGLRTAIDVSYQSEPLFGFLVPVEMRERYEGDKFAIAGTAEYRNFRRFGVDVQEAIGPLRRP